MSDAPDTLPIGPSWSRAACDIVERHLAGGMSASAIEAMRSRLLELAFRADCPQADSLYAASDISRYSRHQLVAEPDIGYSCLLIQWPAGHATPLHDHDGLWGIELVLDGALQVEEFRKDESPGSDGLAHARTLVLGVGDAAAFADPRYVHRCRNLSARKPALSLHVYGGLLERFNTFEPDVAGRYQPSRYVTRLDSVAGLAGI